MPNEMEMNHFGIYVHVFKTRARDTRGRPTTMTKRGRAEDDHPRREDHDLDNDDNDGDQVTFSRHFSSSPPLLASYSHCFRI